MSKGRHFDYMASSESIRLDERRRIADDLREQSQGYSGDVDIKEVMLALATRIEKGVRGG